MVAATAGTRARPSASAARPGGNLSGGCRLSGGRPRRRCFRLARAPAASAVELAQTAAEHAEYWTKYAFMFPVSVCVATTAMLTGIGGAALFSPIFLLGFPALGPEFPLATPAEAFNVALLTECFGFTSGLLGYSKRGLVDWRVSRPFIAVGAPFGIAGGLAVASADPDVLRAAYGAATLVLGVALFFPAPEREAEETLVACDENSGQGKTPEAASSSGETSNESRVRMTLVDSDGTRHAYAAPRADVVAVVATALGGALTGLLSVGIGESVVPQLTRRGAAGERVPLPVAAGTSVSVVIVVALAFPKNLVCWTVPGVVCGGQIGPRLQGKLRQSVAERAVGVVFVCVGVAFLSAGLKGGG